MSWSTGAWAEGFILGVGLDGDTADGRAVTALGDFGIGEKTWISALASASRTEGIIQDNDVLFTDVGLDHWFKPFGVRIGGGYWGNSDILDSRDLRGSIYLRGEPGSLAIEYENRDFVFDLQSDLLRGQSIKFSADGWGLRARLALGDRLSFFLSGMAYDYSRNIRIQPDIDALAFLSSSRLSMMNSLLDERFNGGLEFKFGLRSIDVNAGRWTTAIDGSEIDSYSIGFLTPVSDRTDMELRLSLDESETFGRTTAFTIYLYYFGGV